MKTHMLILVVFLGISFSGCNKTVTEPDNDDDNQSTNLIHNGSFELDGEPTIEGWQGTFGLSLDNLINDAPPNGGEWCVRLPAAWAPDNYISYLVEDINDGDKLYFSAYVRVEEYSVQGGYMAIEVGKGSDRSYVTLIYLFREYLDWTKLSYEGTVSIDDDDSLWVEVGGGYTHAEEAVSRFDLITLEKIEY
jgi:hypothetical protein